MGNFALLMYMSEFRRRVFVVLVIGNSKSNHLNAQGTFKPNVLTGMAGKHKTTTWPSQDTRLLRGCCARIQPSFHPPPRTPVLLTLVQYYCTIVGKYATPLPTSRLDTIYHRILVITVSCKGQTTTHRYRPLRV